MMSELFEVAMVLAFGAAWPASILKSYRSRTARGKSIFFILIVAFGYTCGIASKFTSGRINYVVIFYMLNLVAVCIDGIFYLRNHRLDKLADQARQAECERPTT